MLKKLREYIIDHRLTRQAEKKLRNTKVSSHQISLYYFLIAFIRNLNKNDIYIKASGVAFHFTMAIFPTVIFVFTLIPYIPINNLETWMFSMLNSLIPGKYVEAADSTIFDLVATRRSGLMSFGFISAFYLATNGVKGLMNAFNSCYHLPDSRNFFKKQLIATLLTVLLAIIFFVSIILLILENFVVSKLIELHVIEKGELISYIISFFGYLVIVVMFFSVITTIYRFAPGVPSKWGFFSRGAVFASIMAVLVTEAFSFYIDNFGSYNKLFGSLGIFLALMAWQLAISMILLVGFEINATFDELKHRIEKVPLLMNKSSKKPFEAIN